MNGYVYNVAMKVGLELKASKGGDLKDRADVNLMTMSKLVGAVAQNFPEKISASQPSTSRLTAMQMLIELPV